MDCIWTSSSKGVTLRFLAPCSQKYQMFADSILSQILNRLNRKDTSNKILVLVNTERLSYPNTNFSNFISIGFDTLRQIDESFINDYYFGKEGQIKRRFPNLPEPLDINLTDSDTSKEVGIKIIYRLDYRIGKENWVDIEKLIKYSEENREDIRKTQKRSNVRYDYNGWSVSLLTIDSLTTKNILLKKDSQNKQLVTSTKYLSQLLISSFIGLLLIVILIIIKRKHSR